MTDRTALPPAVAAELARAELVAYDHNLRRWRAAVDDRRRTPGQHARIIDPVALTERVAARITEIEEASA